MLCLEDFIIQANPELRTWLQY